MTSIRPSPIPDTYRRVTPCLTVQGAANAMDFYAEVFGATERMRFSGPEGTVAHSEIEIGDSVVTAARGPVLTSSMWDATVRYGTSRYATVAATMAVPVAVAKAFAAPLRPRLRPTCFL